MFGYMLIAFFVGLFLGALGISLLTVGKYSDLMNVIIDLKMELAEKEKALRKLRLKIDG